MCLARTVFAPTKTDLSLQISLGSIPCKYCALASVGGFLFLDSKYTVTSSSDSEEATLLSQRFSSTTTGVRCFSFSYWLFLEGNAEPGLYVVQYLVAGEGDRNLFSAGNSTGGMWVNVELDIKPDQGKDFYLAVTGKVATSAADHTRIGG